MGKENWKYLHLEQYPYITAEDSLFWEALKRAWVNIEIRPQLKVPLNILKLYSHNFFKTSGISLLLGSVSGEKYLADMQYIVSIVAGCVSQLLRVCHRDKDEVFPFGYINENQSGII